MDGRRSVQFEETILITETGVEILTRPPPSATKHRKKKKKAVNGHGHGSGAATPTSEVAAGVEGLAVEEDD